MAAVLAAGPDAVASHRSAAWLWEIRPHRVAAEITSRRHCRSRSGVIFHRGSPRADEVTYVRRIPTTTAPRTLLDLAAVLAPRQVERAINEAEVRRLTDQLSLHDLAARYPRRRGVGLIRSLLADLHFGRTVTRSELEERFLGFLDRYGFTRPAVNADLAVAGRWVVADFVWRRNRLVVELDGHAFHSTAAAFERDRARDRALNAEGWRVVRVTWRQLHDEPEALAVDLRLLLSGG